MYVTYVRNFIGWKDGGISCSTETGVEKISIHQLLQWLKLREIDSETVIDFRDWKTVICRRVCLMSVRVFSARISLMTF